MKLSTTSHTLSAHSTGAAQELSAGCTQVSVFADTAMDIGVVPGSPHGAIGATTVQTDNATRPKIITIDFNGVFGVGDVLSIGIDGTSISLTVGSDNAEICASDYFALANANATITADIDLSVSGNKVTCTHKTNNTDFSISSAVSSRNIPHHIDANERLTLEVPPGATIRAKGSSGTLNISEL